ncbi:sigma-54-dependent transcriptional regulator [Roseibacillus ishigakijimensis]|uniref:Sigma-54-dependent Fis family transcriptional regulator n=1 Tax=Roseibacillus ishigakijimensis TaxID=454146 RepID=A0A934VNI6_9BACT|nr:sigma-54 dependent transcriptional regulator [Roseibacillus ishigakijimensis]MBK1835141.1 sigma-54-dependent Fis family transcriptional regulator [Roseibacillus ishigakijimensis]
MPFDLVIVEDEEITRRLLSLKARDFGFRTHCFATAEEGLAAIEDETRAILLDLGLPGMSGFELLEILAKRHPGLPSVVLTAADGAQEAVRAMKLGAFDYLTKPFDPQELFECLHKAGRLREVQQENEALRESISTPTTSNATFVAEAPVSKDLVARARKVAGHDSTILLTGESGSGKGALARFLHQNSPRADAPFVTVSCPALPRELLESELFGHEKGAFTGALKRRIGKIESARGGTLFLDEIGDLPLDLQPKLLNVLQDREFQRIGGNDWISSDVRLVAATNIDFEEKIAAGEFREDLYYRLSVIPLELPPLRERPEDIPALAQRILQSLSSRRKGPALRLEAAALKALTGFRWPGNVRQLENTLERASAFCEANTIRLTDLPSAIQKPSPDADKVANAPAGLAGLSLAQVEAEAIRQTLSACGGNKSEAARRLGIAEKSVYNKMKKYGIELLPA